jgi:prepilin-type N-terminal cleavage/methylation domain-containing protein
MRQRIRALRASDNGFTLTELLIVIVILGVLTGIVVFAVGAFTDKGETAACKSDRKAVEVATEAFRAQTGAYPPAGAAGLTQLKTDGYLRDVPSSTKYYIDLAAAGVVTGHLGTVAAPGATC